MATLDLRRVRGPASRGKLEPAAEGGEVPVDETLHSVPVDPLENALESDEDILMASVRDVADTLSARFAGLDELGDDEIDERLRLLRHSVDTLRDLLQRLERVHEVAIAAHRVRGAGSAERDAAQAKLMDALEKLDELV
jgi:hypothetical protein